MHTRYRIWLTLFSIVVLAGAVRFLNLGYKDMWYDEAVVVWIAEGDLTQTIDRNNEWNSAPPLYVVIVSGLYQLSADSTLLRLASAVPSFLTVVALFFLLREFFSDTVALLTVGLFAIAPTASQYAQELREYTLSGLMTCLLLLFFIRYLRTGQSVSLGLLAATMAVSIFAHYGLALVIAALNLIFLAYWWQRGRPRSQLAGWVAAQVVVVLAVVVVTAVALSDQFRADGFASEGYLEDAYWDGTPRGLVQLLGWNSYLLVRFSFNAGWLTLNAGQPAVVYVLTVGVGLLALLLRARHEPLPLMLLVTPIALTMGFALFSLFPYSGGRQNYFLSPLVYLAAASGIELSIQTARRFVPQPVVAGTIAVVAVVVLLMLPGALKTVDYLQSEGRAPIEPLAAWYNAESTTDDVTVVPMQVYYPLRLHTQHNIDAWLTSAPLDPDTWPGNTPNGQPMRRVWVLCQETCAAEWESVLGATHTRAELRQTTNSEDKIVYTFALYTPRTTVSAP
jgi:uncharacterized membrane protein